MPLRLPVQIWDRDKKEDETKIDRRHSTRDGRRSTPERSRKRATWSSEDLRASAVPPRVTTAYPAFSKAHSKESLGRKERRRASGPAREERDGRSGLSKESRSQESVNEKPPSPPTTPSSQPKPKGRRKSIDSLNTRATRSEESLPQPELSPSALEQASQVDYLLQHGGLPGTVRRTFMSSVNDSQFPGPAPQIDAFLPFTTLLQDYESVLDQGGSVAVATGYKSVARKLLDRLESVFARDIAASCVCPMCETPRRGVTWGELLEWVGGRRQLPQWPPFYFDGQPSTDMAGLSDIASDVHVLDPDTPAEYRDHYLKQTKLTKAVVSKWMENFDTDTPEVDDETLCFAILTRLDPQARQTFTKLMRSDISGSCISIQRLYRLSKRPKMSEAALYMLKNPGIHGVLQTLSGVNEAEWEILISGRFDGFLWGGSDMGMSTTSLRASRTSLSRTSGTPVTHDEETEMKIIADIERDIFQGMEMLEDAFENLHQMAESVRQKLRLRKQALSQAVEARNAPEFEEEEEPDWDDNRSELRPDDSASMVNFNRRRKKARAPPTVQEEEE